MKYLFFAIACFIHQTCFTQITLPKIYTSTRGKDEFKKQAQSENPNYVKAYLSLLDEIRQRPNNAELHYFLGYTIDRMNANDGIGMQQLNKAKTISASKEFEKVNTLEPIYKGEYIISDPYSKLTGIWGSLAQAYLIRNMLDSAKWAFIEGKKRGGFIEPILSFDRQVLNSCEKNSILITSGDNVTIGCWYLQTIEAFRTDITIVDASLINTSWYPKYLKSSKKLRLSYTDYDIDTIDYLKWLPQQIEIINSKDTTQKLSWELRPTYMNSYLLKGDRILLDIFKNNYFDRPINFTNPADTAYSLFLNNHLIDED